MFIQKARKIFIKIGVTVAVLGVLIATPIFASSIYGGTGPNLGVSKAAKVGLSDVDVRISTARMIRLALGLLGIIFVVIVIWGGYEWMTAAGNDQQIGEAKKRIYTGAIGLAIILSSYAIATFVLRGLYNASITGI